MDAQLERMKDSAKMMDLKNQSAPKTAAVAKKKDPGFKLYHLILMSVFGLLLGAYLQVTFLKPANKV